MAHIFQEVQQIRLIHSSSTLATGYLSDGRLLNCLDVIPGNEEMERDDSRDCSSDVSSGLSMSVKNAPQAGKDVTPPLQQPSGGGNKLTSQCNLRLPMI